MKYIVVYLAGRGFIVAQRDVNGHYEPYADCNSMARAQNVANALNRATA